MASIILTATSRPTVATCQRSPRPSSPAAPSQSASTRALPLPSASSLASTRALRGGAIPGRRNAVRRTRSNTKAVRVTALRNIDEPEALLFDCDGVLVDTEKDGHRVSFNKAFKMKGLDHEWGVEKYGELLQIGGGKERMLHYFTGCQDQEPFKSITDEDARWEFCKEMHKLKTELFMEMIESGAMPLREGVSRIINEAIDRGVKVAVCSTSNEKAVSTIVRVLLGPKVYEAMPVFAGDMVPKKKPDPAIYKLAAEELEVDPARCVVIEDSRIGLLAARAAGMRCVITESSYTVGENFDIADVVFDCIGNEGDERFSLDDLTTPGMEALIAARASA